MDLYSKRYTDKEVVAKFPPYLRKILAKIFPDAKPVFNLHYRRWQLIQMSRNGTWEMIFPIDGQPTFWNTIVRLSLSTKWKIWPSLSAGMLWMQKQDERRKAERSKLWQPKRELAREAMGDVYDRDLRGRRVFGWRSR